MSLSRFTTEEEMKDMQELVIEAKRGIAFLQGNRNYRYVNFLAQGGYGWVALIYDDGEQKALAVKCTQATSEMELSWWPKLQHTNILPLLEYITLDSCTIFLMPAMRKDIYMCVSEPHFYEDELSFGLCRIWLGDVAAALDYLHQLSLCHLDIKLDNIFLKEDGHVCLGDFSLLSNTREVPKGFHFLEMYEPPEYTDWCYEKKPSKISESGDFTGDKADMWQFGVLTIDLLTNMKFSSNNSQFLMFEHDIWPFIQKILDHQEYLEFLLEHTFQNVLFNDFDFDSCHDLVHKILCLEPQDRMTAHDVMEHGFVKVEWPQLPSEFSIPKVVSDRPVSIPLPSKQTNEEESASEKNPEKMAREGEHLSQSLSKATVEALQKKRDKLKQKKLNRRESIAAEAGKKPAKILANISASLLSLRARSEKSNLQQSNPNKLKQKRNSKKLSVIPSTISNNKKLVAKVTTPRNELTPGSSSRQDVRKSASAIFKENENRSKTEDSPHTNANFTSDTLGKEESKTPANPREMDVSKKGGKALKRTKTKSDPSNRTTGAKARTSSRPIMRPNAASAKKDTSGKSSKNTQEFIRKSPNTISKVTQSDTKAKLTDVPPNTESRSPTSMTKASRIPKRLKSSTANETKATSSTRGLWLP